MIEHNVEWGAFCSLFAITGAHVEARRAPTLTNNEQNNQWGAICSRITILGAPYGPRCQPTHAKVDRFDRYVIWLAHHPR